ncbi:UDP-glucuronosyltransferase 2B33-like [Pomacea canaliculata]|uniref:UDP-glucuronosyltransferase 2B33-like n=1 Tax=Pomacea canaliculata TaxID=400727 RepID=UPI000D72C3AC|nr:UDP-glucuronosyltransferase 2B33-like [Pomacea canaliculata]
MAKRRLFLWFAVCTVLQAIHLTQGKRVVVMPMPAPSHTKYMTHVAQVLAQQGHEVWVTIADYVVNKRVLDTTNFTIIELTALPNYEEILMEGFAERYFKCQKEDVQLFFRTGKEFCDRILSNNSFFEQIKTLRPDFFVLDNLPFTKMLAIIPYRLGVPFAFLGTAYEPNAQRIPIVPCNIPYPFTPFNRPTTFYQRVVNSLFHLASSLMDPSVYKDAVSRYAPDMPYLPMDMLIARAEIWLVETDHILDYPKPSMPNVKLIGGTATGPGKPLPPQFKHFMDDAEEGVVIVTFGSQILSPPTSITQKILKVLTDLPFKSVFRSNISSPNSEKILTSSWIPQNDLLAHPNTRVFVSHCGKNGQYEALYHAVPVVATPIFADQSYNAERMRVKGFAEIVDLNTVSTDELYTTIVQVATNKSYKQAITKASELFKIEFGVPVEKAAFWLNHVMKYGGDHLRSSGHEFPFYQFACWDVYAFLFASALLAFLIAVLSLYKLFFFLRSKSKQKDE